MSVVDNLNRIKSCKEEIKQAIIDKGVDMTNIPFTDYASKISEIQSGSGEGSGDYLDIRNTMTTYSNRNVEEIPDYSFNNFNNLTSVNLPNVKRINDNAFGGCGSLSSVNIPKCEYVGYYSFKECYSLQSIDLPECKDIGSGAFSNNILLNSVNIQNCKKIESSTFNCCYQLDTIDLPICEEIGPYAFNETNLTSIDLPECTKVDYNCFSSCHSLNTANLPNCMIIGGSCFEWCENLTSVNLPVCTNISYSTFNGCRALTELDLRKTYKCTLETPDAFNETPLRNGEGSIYVHNSVLSQFQNAENWSEFADRFVGVGDASEVLLGFEDGRMYGDTYVINNNFEEYLGISKNDITSINLPNVSRLFINDWGEGVNFNYCYNLTLINFENATYVGRDMFYNCRSLSTVYLPNCAYIGDGAFKYCSSLTELDLPNCAYIGNAAFQYCSSLTELDLPNCAYIGNAAFGGCSNLKILTIGTNLTTVCETVDAWIDENIIQHIFVPAALIEEYKNHHYWGRFADRIEANEWIVFNDGRLNGRATAISMNEINNLGISKSDITSIDLPCCETVYQNTFKNCVNLQSVNLPKCITIYHDAFHSCGKLNEISLPSCCRIENAAFCSCVNLQSVNLPKCEYVGYNGFDNAGLLSIYLPNCTEIQNSGLARCPNLQYANLPRCSYLGWGVFDDTILTELHIGTYSIDVCEAPGAGIPEGIEKIYVSPAVVDSYKEHEYWSAFANVIEGETVLRVVDGCLTGNITDIQQNWRDEYGIYDNITSIDLPLCHNVGYNSFYNIIELKEVYLPTCWNIEENAFAYCYDLNDIQLDECNEIGGGAFRYCYGLQEIYLPMCNTIGDQAFYDCNRLETANLPQCRSIGYQTFYGGAELRTMYVGTETDTVCSVGDETIPGLNMTTIYVPASLVEDYKTTPVWSEFADKFVGV